MTVTVDTSELNRWERTLVRAGIEIVKVNEQALTEATKQLREDARRDVPVDTGDLQKSIRITAGKEFRRVGSKLRYSGFVELGTVRTPAQPFLFHNGDRAGVTVERELTKGGVRVLLGP